MTNRSLFVSVVTLLLALLGGIKFYLQPDVLWFSVVAGWGTIAWAAWLIVTHRAVTIPFWSSLKWLYAAVIFSILANLDIYQAALGRLWLYSLALAVLILSHHYLDADTLWSGLYWAGWGWIIVCPALFLELNRFGEHNIFAAWSMLFVAVGLYGHNWYFLVLCLISLVFFGSRGAIAGTIAIVVVYLWPVLRRSKLIIVIGSLLLIAFFVRMFSWRPGSAFARFYYWLSAWDAFIDEPLLGVGPGGLKIRQLIPETGGGYMPHAHNIFISWLAELGLVGLFALVLSIYELRNRPHILRRWQLAILVGLFTHNLVDEPLFWPGPLLLVAMVIGTIQETQWTKKSSSFN